MKKPIKECTVEELREFATVVLQLNIVHNAGRNAIIAKIKSAYDKDDIEILEKDAPVQTPKPEKKDRKYVTVVINAVPGPGGAEPVPVSVNGRAMWIERGKPQRIPEEYYEVLKNAISTEYPTIKDGTLGQPINKQAYPHSVISA